MKTYRTMIGHPGNKRSMVYSTFRNLAQARDWVEQKSGDPWGVIIVEERRHSGRYCPILDYFWDGQTWKIWGIFNGQPERTDVKLPKSLKRRTRP